MLWSSSLWTISWAYCQHSRRCMKSWAMLTALRHLVRKWRRPLQAGRHTVHLSVLWWVKLLGNYYLRVQHIFDLSLEKTGNKLNYSKAVTGSCPLRCKLKVTRRQGYPVPITRIVIIAGIEEWKSTVLWFQPWRWWRWLLWWFLVDGGNNGHNVGVGGVTMPKHCLAKLLVTNTSFFLL